MTSHAGHRRSSLTETFDLLIRILKLIVFTFLGMASLTACCTDPNMCPLASEQPYLPNPSITNISPTEAAVGENVTINGTNFGENINQTSVKIGGQLADKKSISSTGIVVIVPNVPSGGQAVTVESGQPARVSNSVNLIVKSTTSTPGSNGNIAVSVEPAEVTLTTNYRQAFIPTVTGGNTNDVTWDLDGSPLTVIGSILEWLAPGNPGTYLLRAKSKENPNKTFQVKVKVVSEKLRIKQVVDVYENIFVVKSDDSLWSSDLTGNATKVLENVLEVSAGYRFNLAIRKDGSLWSWGENSDGQLGNGTVKNSSIPQEILNNVIFASAGYNHSFAIKSDGTLWAWGNNLYGQLGNGSAENSNVPKLITYNAVDVSAGVGHSVLLKSDASVWAWGNNQCGQIGDGTTLEKTLPQKISENGSHIVAGTCSSSMVKTDGKIWSWGQINTSKTPVYVGGSSWATTVVSLGFDHAIAVDTAQRLSSWGQNQQCQLGNGNQNSVSAPASIIADKVIIAAAGTHASVALKVDGSVWTWGDPYGVASSLKRCTPTQILTGAKIP
jgi:hypothetical protein